MPGTSPLFTESIPQKSLPQTLARTDTPVAQAFEKKLPDSKDPIVYAVLAGVNEYLPPNSLKGCINDIEAFQGWLQKKYPDDKQLHIKKLVDTEKDSLPTRDNIIASFQHFEAAKNNDICVFYFCGHGTNLSDPPPFLSDTGTNTVQALVCRDLEPGNRYIVDKELSYLVWKATKDKPALNFIAIMDCCHSGTVTRDLGSDGPDFLLRTFITADRSPVIESFTGFGEMIDGEPGYEMKEGKYIVKRGGHIQIGAALDTQTAAEIQVNGNSRGSFTYALLKYLQQNTDLPTYGQVVNATKSLVKNLFTVDLKIKHEQTPVINLNGGLPVSHLDRLFLSDVQGSKNASYSLYNDAQYGWCLQAGLLLGVETGSRVLVQASDGTLVLTVKQVNLMFSTLTDGDALVKKGIQYRGVLAGVSRRPLTIGFAEQTGKELQEQIAGIMRQVLGANEATGFTRIEVSENEPGILEVNVNAASEWHITRTGRSELIFGPVPLLAGPEMLQAFPAIMQKIDSWEYLRNMRNDSNILSSTDYLPDLQITRGLDDTGAYIFEKGTIGSENNLTYLSGRQPAFKLRLQNSGSSLLYASCAYLDADFGIYTDLFEPLQVEPGKEQWLLFRNEGTVIKLGNQKPSVVREYLKIFISNKEPILLEALDQAPAQRSIGSEDPGDNIDGMWTALTIEFAIGPKKQA